MRAYFTMFPPRARVLCLGVTLLCLAGSVAAREPIRLDGPPGGTDLAPLTAPSPFQLGSSGWRFHLGDVPGADQPGFDDAAWTPVALPHDWSITGARSADAPSAGGGGFFPTGIGWYRLGFRLPEHWREQRLTLEFEGIYGEADVFLNGQSLGRHRSGYTPFRFDVTSGVRPGATNTLAIRVDNTAQPNSRWYSGSGLYRSVWLTATNPLHVEADSIFVRVTDLFAEAATVAVDASLRNDTAAAVEALVEVTIADPAGLPVTQVPLTLPVPARGTAALHTKAAIPHPRVWSPDTPERYRVILRVYDGARLADRTDTAFGVRTVDVSADGGLRLNGQAVKLNGANVHHDHGPLGAAAFPAAEERKVRLLKAAGFNAVRTAHHPPSTAFLDACDRLGMLVIDELFDGWAKPKLKQDASRHFAETWEADVDAIIRRDRNHPSVLLWSIGNEVYERGSAAGAELAAAMRQRIRALDTTRPLTAGINGLGAAGDWTRLDRLFASLDVAGYNYELHRHAKDHQRLPRRVILGAESYPRDVFAAWRTVQAHPYVIGDFVWSGQDYLGEAGIGRVFGPAETPFPHWEGNHFPWHGAACGDLDLLGRRKPVSHYRAIVWDRGETLFAAVVTPTPDGRPWNLSAWAMPPLQASWTWPGHEGRPLQVEVYSRHPAVRLYLNDQLVGEAATTEAEEFRASFEIPYAPGHLRAVGLRDGQEVERFELVTAGPPHALRLAHEPGDVVADGQDLVFVSVEAVDQTGRPYPLGAHAVTYHVDGPATIAGIGSADLASKEAYGANPRRLFQGRALVVLRTTHAAGEITLTAQAAELAPATLRLNAQPAHGPEAQD